MIKPILFNTLMVRAILEGRKTVTRRLIKPQPKSPVAYSCGVWQETEPCANGVRVFTPPYAVGDILYVRETWAKCPDLFGEFPQYIYRANYSDTVLTKEETTEEIETDFPYCIRWRPSIHMPKEAARIFLRVKAVRIERLRDMVFADVLMEGISERNRYEDIWEQWHNLWDSTIPAVDRPTYGWHANPYVWVIEFERCRKDGTV